MDKKQSSSLKSSGQELCATCGKPTGNSFRGSLTGWIFQDKRCTCAEAEKQSQPLLPESMEILDLIGVGGMGSVYRVNNHCRQAIVAVKVMRKELVADQNAVARFQQEVEAAAKLEHPNLVEVYGFGQGVDGSLYLEMEYLEGPNLATLIEAIGPIPEDRALKLFEQIACGLSHAHQMRVVHRDLKPSNMIIQKDENGEDLVKVVDFGIAKVLDKGSDGATSKLTQTGDILGSPFYMSPEQCQGEALGPLSDVYSFGCVMYQCLTGRPPFTEENPVKTVLQHLYDEPPPFSQTAPDTPISSGLMDVVLTCLEKKPVRRYKSMDRLKADLQRLRNGLKPITRRKKAELAGGLKVFRNVTVYCFLAVIASSLLMAIVCRDDFDWLSGLSQFNLTALNKLAKRQAIASKLVAIADNHNRPFAILLLAGTQYSARDLDTAFKTAKEGLSILQSRDDFSQNQIPFYRLLYTIELDRGDFNAASENLNKILAIVDDRVRNREGIKAIRAIGGIYLPQRPYSRYSVLVDFVDACFLRGRIENVASIYQKTLTEARAAESRAVLVRLLLRYANLLGFSNQSEQVGLLRDEARQAIELVQTGEQRELLRKLGDDYLADRSYVEAEKVYLKLVDKDEFDPLEAHQLVLDRLRLAYSYLLEHKDEKAFALYDRALADTSSAIDTYEGRRVLRSYANALMLRGRYQEANAHLVKLLSIYTKTNNPMRQATVGVELAKCLLGQGKPNEAKEMIDLSRARFTSVKFGPLQQESRIYEEAKFYRNCARIETGLGNEKGAADLQARAKKLTDSLTAGTLIKLILFDRDDRIVESNLDDEVALLYKSS